MANVSGKAPYRLSSHPALGSSLGSYAPHLEKRLRQMKQQQFARRFWGKDPTLWKSGEELGRAIRNRLGWLSVIGSMQEDCGLITSFADQVRTAGFTHALLLGMGGSSLCAEVCRRSFGVAPGFLDLAVLDSTDPEAVRNAERRSPAESTLFLVSTKSGTTTETLCFFRYFFEKVKKIKGDRAGDHFIAITDPGTPLVELAAQHRFRRTFLNPAEIGGRFSVLSYFGLVPAALLGIDIRKLLERAGQFLPQGAARMDSEENPAIQLGALLGELGLRGRDKVTFFLSPRIAAFGYWVEQLLAESTGKEGKGLFPVCGEPPAGPEAYGKDRLFVHLHLQGSRDTETIGRLARLEKAGHPVVRFQLSDRLDLGAEFFRWEVATAVAASLMRINAFDEPDVTQTKNNTSRLLRELQSESQPAGPPPLMRDSSVSLYGDGAARTLLRRIGSRPAGAPARIVDVLGAHLRRGKAGGYLALLAFVTPSQQRDRWLQQIRARLRDTLRVATSLGYGPRYLHSTGQFHKGGPPKGLFVEITTSSENDLPIPGMPYSFGQLKHAQALGDLEALEARKHPILRLHLEKNPELGLRRLVRWIENALQPRSPSAERKTEKARRPQAGSHT